MARRLADLALSEGDAVTWRAIAWEHEWLHSSPGIPGTWHGRIPDKCDCPTTLTVHTPSLASGKQAS